MDLVASAVTWVLTPYLKDDSDPAEIASAIRRSVAGYEPEDDAEG